MKLLLKAFALALSVAALAGCQTVTDAPTGAYQVGDSYQVTLGREWSDVSRLIGLQQKGVRVLSIDGPMLNLLYLTEGLSAGDALVHSTVAEKPTPVYRADFSDSDTIEFVTDSLAALGYEKVASVNPRPAKFGGGDAVRFDVTCQNKDGLEISGTALTAQTRGKLFVLLFLAPTEHYYSDTLPEVDSIMASAVFKAPA